MNLENVKFLWASEEINKSPNEYWSLVTDISLKFSLSRIKECVGIMGREANDLMPTAQILYPSMQCADVVYLKVDMCQLGMDQR
jgi:tyrosyl-tRNA synthetase